MERICVFCGSNAGRDGAFIEAARALGRSLAEQGIGLVYGGASVGLMGAVADAALTHGGEVIGVIPRALVDKEIAHRNLPDLRVVGSMHERKALMAELSDGFVALPGGAGTLEELFEVWTWGQLGHHAKPCALFNVAGFYDGLDTFLNHVARQGFMRQAHREMLILADTLPDLFDRLRDFRPPTVTKWIRDDQR